LTTAYVAKWNQSGTSVYLNHTVAKVGIGTTSPTETLTVIGDINATGNLNVTGDLYVGGNIIIPTNSKLIFGNATGNRTEMYHNGTAFLQTTY